MEPEHREMVLAISNDTGSLVTMRDCLESMIRAPLIKTEGTPRAFELLRVENPSVVLLDISDGKINYIDLAAVVDRMGLPVVTVLITHPKDRNRAIQSLEQGAYDFIEKPIEGRLFNLAMGRAFQHASSIRFSRMYDRLIEETVEEKTLELVQRKDFLAGILNSSTLVSVIVTDLDQNVRFWNRGAENIFGYTAQEMIGTKITRLYPDDPATTQIVEALQHRVQSKEHSVNGKMQQVAKDGRPLTMSLAISPMLGTSGEVQGILGIGLDVTEETRLNQELFKSFQLLKETQDVSIFSLARLAESRDEETGLHLTRIQHYCRVLCHRLATRDAYHDDMTSQFVEDLIRSSVLHDIGKVAVPDSVLLSANKFTKEEYDIMCQHPLHGGNALDDAVRRLGKESFLSTGRDVAYYHHEHWDGNGYPFGLKGEAIPLSARIVAMADVYDALTTERRYKRAFTHEEACAIILENKAKQFDPEIVEAFAETEKELRTIRHELSTQPPKGYFPDLTD
jgi:PAS domain S-box-containing protein